MTTSSFLSLAWRQFSVHAGSDTPPLLKGSEAQWRLKFKEVIVPTILRLAAKYPFDFAIGEKTYTLTASDASNNTIELRGKSADARGIRFIAYGTGLAPLEPWGRMKFKRQVGKLAGGVYAWYPLPKTSSGYPRIALINAGSVGDDLNYEYVKKNLTIANWPDEFIDVLLFNVLERFDSVRFKDNALRELSAMIQFYDTGNELPMSLELASDWRTYADQMVALTG